MNESELRLAIAAWLPIKEPRMAQALIIVAVIIFAIVAVMDRSLLAAGLACLAASIMWL